MSKYILCQNTKEDNCFCNSCKTFNNHPDFFCIGRNEKILVDDIDLLIEFVSRAPLISSTKVVVIDNAENISTEAANRILKVLEESTYTFILISSYINRILPTIQSRCVKVKFDALNQEDITNILWQKLGFELPQARVIGWIGAGSTVDIFSHAGQYLKYRNASVDLMTSLTTKDFLGVLDQINKIDRDDLPYFLDTTLLVLTDILLLKKSMEAIICSDRKTDLQKPVEMFKDMAVLLIINDLLKIKSHEKLNINVGMAIKTTFMKVWPVLK